MKRVAIIVLNWNQPELTYECVNSLLGIDYNDFIVIVVDNGSNIDKYRKLRKLIEENEIVKIVRSENNLLYAGGNNFGYQFARQFDPDYVLFLNNDTIVDRQFLRKLVDLMDKHNEVGVVGPKIYYSEKPDTIWHAGGYVNFLTGKIAHYGIRKKDSEKWNEIREVDFVSGCALLIRNEIFDRLGGFDKSYGLYSEDVDLCYRVKRMGYKVYYMPEARIWHKISHSTGGYINELKVKSKFISNLKFFKKYARKLGFSLIIIFMFIQGFWYLLRALLSLDFKTVKSLIKGVKLITINRGKNEV